MHLFYFRIIWNKRIRGLDNFEKLIVVELLLGESFEIGIYQDMQSHNGNVPNTENGTEFNLLGSVVNCLYFQQSLPEYHELKT